MAPHFPRKPKRCMRFENPCSEEAHQEIASLGNAPFHFVEKRGQNATDQSNMAEPITISLLTQASPATTSLNPPPQELNPGTPQSQGNYGFPAKRGFSSTPTTSFSDCEGDSDSDGSGIILSQWQTQKFCERDPPALQNAEAEAPVSLGEGTEAGNLAAARCSKESEGGAFVWDFACEENTLERKKSPFVNRGEIIQSGVPLKSSSLNTTPGEAHHGCKPEDAEWIDLAPSLDKSQERIGKRGSVEPSRVSDCSRPSGGLITSGRGKENSGMGVKGAVSHAVDLCVICGLDLGGMSLEGKTQHVNRCCDHAERLFGEKANGGNVAEAKVSVEAFLRELKLAKYLDVFAACHFDIDALLELTDAKLIQMGLPLGPRKKILIGAAVLKSSGIKSHSTVSKSKRKRRSRINVSNIKKKLRKFEAAFDNENDIQLSQLCGDALQVLMKNAKQGLHPTPTPVNFREMELRAVGGLYEILEVENIGAKGSSVQRFVDIWGAERPAAANCPFPLFQLHFSKSPISCPLREPPDARKQTSFGQPEKASFTKSLPLDGPKKGESKSNNGKESLGVKLVKLRALREELRLLEQSVCSIKASIRCVEEEIEQEKPSLGEPG